jgi:hypothetical protein
MREAKTWKSKKIPWERKKPLGFDEIQGQGRGIPQKL